jgi:hypothetical protein
MLSFFGVIPIALLCAGVANGRNLIVAFGAARSCRKSGEATGTNPSRLRHAACKQPSPRAASSAKVYRVVRLPRPRTIALWAQLNGKVG